MDQNKIIAAILTIAASARDARTASKKTGKEPWQRVVKDYDEILSVLNKRQP